jgi:IMP dehydrogenase/GMP reductase
MLNEEIRIGLTFDNVLLVPAKSEQISEQIRDPSHIITM